MNKQTEQHRKTFQLREGLASEIRAWVENDYRFTEVLDPDFTFPDLAEHLITNGWVTANPDEEQY